MVRIGGLNVTPGNLGRALRHPRQALARVRGCAPFPRHVTAMLTYRCNLRCRMCNLWGEHGVCSAQGQSPVDLSPELFARLYEEVRHRSERLLLFGGEPTLHPRFAELLQLLQPDGVRIALETNGQLLKKYTDALVNCPPFDQCTLSLDGPPAVHDTIRGMPGAWDRAIDGLRALVAAARERHKPLHISVRCVIGADNHPLLTEFAQQLAAEPVDTLIIQHVMYEHKALWEEQVRFTKKHFHEDVPWDRGLPAPPTGVEPARLLTQLNQLRTMDLPFDVLVNPAYPDEHIPAYYQAAEELPEPVKGCRVIYDNASVDARGEVMLCTGVSAGNIAEQSLAALWNGPRYRALRRVMREERAMPYCKVCCYLGD